MDATLVRAGAQSATFFIPTDSQFTRLGIADWQKLPKGQLRNLLTTLYVSETDPNLADPAKFARACADVSLTIHRTLVGAELTSPVLLLSGGEPDSPPGDGPVGSPVYVGIISPFGCSITFSTAYSASE